MFTGSTKSFGDCMLVGGLDGETRRNCFGRHIVFRIDGGKLRNRVGRNFDRRWSQARECREMTAQNVG